MFQNLLFGIKRRIIREVEDAFQNHPAFSAKVEVYNKFPYEQRVQYGVILRNTAASQIRMSADNYLADLYSHVRLARDMNYPGLAIEWVRENTNNITKYTENEDLTPQVDPTQRLLHTTYQMMAGLNDTNFITSPEQIYLTINGMEATAESVNGQDKTIILRVAPAFGDIIKVSYWYKTLTPPGIYMVDFIEDNQFQVWPIYTIDNEILVARTNGLETMVITANNDVCPDSEEVFLTYPGSDTAVMFIKGTDYTINYPTGEITFLHPVPVGYQMTTSYRFQHPGEPPVYTFKPYQENHEAIPGIVVSIGRRAAKGDRQEVIVSNKSEPQASIYGGHWDMSLSLAVIAKDPVQMEEMVDQVVNYLWGVRKNILEFEGITLNRVEPTGESEETFIETTGDLYYESTVDVSVMTEWQRFIPYLYNIRHIVVNDIVMAPDTRPVIKYPTMGYERVI